MIGAVELGLATAAAVTAATLAAASAPTTASVRVRLDRPGVGPRRALMDVLLFSGGLAIVEGEPRETWTIQFHIGNGRVRGRGAAGARRHPSAPVGSGGAPPRRAAASRSAGGSQPMSAGL